MNIDVIIPFFNEEGSARELTARVLRELRQIPVLQPRLILVDDGSVDKTPEILDEISRTDESVDVVHLWGNHGHQRALVAGLDRSRGDLVLMMDGDGQHPVDVMVNLVRQILEHPEALVVQAVRRGRQGGSWKDRTSAWYYRICRWLMPDIEVRPSASDFRVMRKPVSDLLKCYPDRFRNMRILLASLHLPTIYVEFDVAARKSGVTGYRFRQMLTLAADGWFAFSLAPLRLSLFLMMCSGLVGIICLIYVLFICSLGHTVPGWSSIIALLSIMFTAVFAVLAIISEYVARIYQDVRRHPVYSIRPTATVEISSTLNDTASSATER